MSPNFPTRPPIVTIYSTYAAVFKEKTSVEWKSRVKRVYKEHNHQGSPVECRRPTVWQCGGSGRSWRWSPPSASSSSRVSSPSPSAAQFVEVCHKHTPMPSYVLRLPFQQTRQHLCFNKHKRFKRARTYKLLFLFSPSNKQK